MNIVEQITTILGIPRILIMKKIIVILFEQLWAPQGSSGTHTKNVNSSFNNQAMDFFFQQWFFIIFKVEKYDQKADSKKSWISKILDVAITAFAAPLRYMISKVRYATDFDWWLPEDCIVFKEINLGSASLYENQESWAPVPC